MYRCLLAIFLLVFMGRSFATEPVQIPKETLSPGPAKLAICDTLEQISSVVTAHREGGIDAGTARFAELGKVPGNGGPACGVALARFYIVRSMWEGEIEGDASFIAEMMIVLPDGTPVVEPLYGVFIGAVLVDEVGQTRL